MSKMNDTEFKAKMLDTMIDLMMSQRDQIDESERMNTQGRKGEKLPRINMAFSPTNHEFIVIMSRLNGLTMTQYVNQLITTERIVNGKKIDKARELLEL